MYSTICHGIQPEVSDTDIYSKLLYRINADPYSLTLGDIVSTEGISVSDKTKALEELQRSQEITGRPNYKAARELFDIDFKQKFGEDLSIDPAEEKAKWLRVFHSYIIDKKMEPLDAAEKIRKDYQVAGQEEPSSQPPPEGNITNTPSQESETQNLKSDIDPTDSLFAGIGKSVIQGITSFPRTFWGTGAMLEDIAKNIPQMIPLAAFTQIVPEDFFKRRYEDVKGIEERFQAKGEGYKKYVNGAIRTMSEMLSQFAGTAGMGTLTGMSTGAGVDKYLGSRKEGYSIPRSFAAGGVTAGVEYVTEKNPLEILGRPGLKFVDRLMKGLVSDVYGEVNAKLAEMSAVDYAILGKSHTPWDYLRALRDTIITAAATTVGATSVTHPFVAGTRSPASPTEQTPAAKTTQTTQQTPEIKQSAKEEVTGIKPEEYAVAKQSQETTETQQATPTKEVYKDYNDFLVKKEERGELGKTTKQERERLITAYNEFPTGKEFVTDLGEKISFAPPEGKSKEEYIHHFLTKFSPDQKKEFYSERYLELVKEIPDTIKKYNKRILGEVNGQDRIYYTREFPGTSKTPHHVLVVSVDNKGKFVGWTHFEAKQNYKQKLLKKEKDVVGKRGLVDAEGNKAEISYDEYGDEKRSALFYLGNNAMSGLQQSQESPSSLNNSIQPTAESVKPEIQLMPSLKGLVDTGRLSIEDALEIDDVARQNNWSEDTVKQFYKSAVEGLGIQNVETQGLASLLVTAKVKEAVYKQNAEKYKQELAEAESQIERISKLLKIEGGAPDKYEAAANDFIKNLGDLKDLKPEDIIRKAQEEFALNLNRLDTGMDVKTLITAAVKTINEAEGISKETVTHEQTINEALKELPGIYNKVMNLKRGKPLTRQQQLAARMLGTSLFEAFNRTKLQGMANPTDQKLYQQAQANLVELGQYWSKVLASSSEIGRTLEAQKIIEKVGADIPATEEFQKVLEMLSGQKEISPEQFYQLTDTLKNPEQLAEMARELAKPVARRIQCGRLG